MSRSLGIALLVAIAVSTVGCSDAGPAASESYAFRSARSLAKAIRTGEITSTALLELYLDRIDRLNSDINAIVAFDLEGARSRAAEADQALSRGELWGPLHGLPITIKDSFAVVGMPTTSGSPEYADFMADQNAVAVQRLLDAGAIVFGKTNLPLLAGDWQTFNDVYGTTNNPWDLDRTPGGSSGGAAAALAAGLTAFELGSDLAGSIRVPAHYTGVYGHKPSFGLVPREGHFPMYDPTQRPPSPLSVVGPMARSADDLDLILDVLVAGGDEEGNRVALPMPRASRLQDYRVAVWLEDSRLENDHEVTEVLENLVTTLVDAGVSVDRAARPSVTLARSWAVDLSILLATTSFRPVPAQALLEQAKIRDQWADFFENYDVVLCPTAQTVAIAHDQSSPENIAQRRIIVNGKPWGYIDQGVWISLATLAGLPATTAPVGLASSALPVGVQIIGPYLGDRSTIDFARRLEDLVGGFEVPPGFE